MKTKSVLFLPVAVFLIGCRKEVPTAKPPKAVSNPPPATVAETETQFSYRILHWNVESGGNDPATIAAQLIELGRYDIVGLSEVDDPEPYVDAITQKWPDDFSPTD